MNICLDTRERLQAYREAFPTSRVKLGAMFRIASIRCPLCFTLHDTAGQVVNCYKKYPDS